MTEVNIELKEIITELRDSTKTVKDGIFIDLTIVSKKIEKICQKINKSPPKDAVETEKQVTAVIFELNQLSERLRQQKNTMPESDSSSIEEKKIEE